MASTAEEKPASDKKGEKKISSAKNENNSPMTNGRDGGPPPEREEMVINLAAEKEEEKKEKEGEGGGMGSYIRLWSYASPLDRVLHLAGFLAACGAGAALPIMTIVFGELVNVFNDWGQIDENGQPKITPQEFRDAVSKNALYFVYLFIGKFCLVYIHTCSFTITAHRIVSRLRIKYVESILKQEIAYFDECSAGTVATKISTNANLIQIGMGEKVGVAIQGLAMLVSAFIVAFIQQWKLSLVTITTLPAVVFLVGITVVWDAGYEKQILAAYAKAGSIAEETLSTVRNVVAFGAKGKLLSKYESHLDTAKAAGIKKGPILGVQYSSEFSIMYCAYALAFWYGIKLLLNGEVSDGGTVVTVFFACMIATSSLTSIAPAIGEITKAGAASKDVLDMFDRKPAIDSSDPSGEKPSTVAGRIELRNVGFRYPARPTVKVVDNLSIVFEEKKTTALVGASGSGKSTVVALAERWYDPEEGDVLFDGYNIKDLNLRWLRSQIGLVQQEPVLFNDTVYNNVAYGLCGSELNSLSEDEKRKLVKEACIEANADAFIESLPDGYDTIVGERAGLLSGGQKQRIAIARSIVSNPSVLLLDEATSALDPKAEAVVQAALDKAAKSRTTIMVSHRLSTVKKADKIVVLNKGEILEQGTHEELLAAEGAYYRLVRAQNLATSSDHEKGKHDDSSSDDASDLPDANAADLDRVLTTGSRWSEKEAYTGDKVLKNSLLKCIMTLLKENARLWPWFSLGFLGSAVGGAVFPVQAVLFSRLVTVFQLPPNRMKKRGDFWALMFFILAITTFLSYGSIGFIWTTVAFLITRRYRSQYFTALISQDIAYYDLPENSSGALTSRLSSDPQHVHDLIQNNAGLILIVIVNLSSSIILAFAIGWKLALVAIFGCLPPLFAAGFVRMRLEFNTQERASKFFLESTRFAAEAVGAVRTVSSLTLEEEVIERYRSKLRGPIKNAYLGTLKTMLLFGLSDSIDLLGNALAFWYGGRLLSFGEYDAVQFFTIFIAIVFGGQAAGFLFGFTSNVTKAHSAANHIIHIRARKPEINSSTGCDFPPPKPETPFIEFRNVRFTYPTRPNAPVLRSLNMRIQHGQTIGLVGASGCGKTTIIALLERFYDVVSGEILINGVPLRDIDVNAYRRKLALVAQEPTLYQGSIKENIMLGTETDDKEIGDAQVERAAKMANIHTFVESLPESYETDVGAKGLALSGGQRQRLAIARALIRDPELLLLDEATSALDTESEKVVQEAIEEASKGRTVIAVAHRLSTIRNADCIFVFEQGRIAETGSHQELWEKKGLYYSMCQGQSLDRQAE